MTQQREPGEVIYPDDVLPTVLDYQSLEHRTRDHILDMIMADGPISAAELAADLEITPTAVRRHLGNLTELGLIETYESTTSNRGRGRPARRFVSTQRAQKVIPGEYPQIANQALSFMAQALGEEAVTKFAAQRGAQLAQQLQPQVTATEVSGRVSELAQALAEEGYMATTRPIPGFNAMQLCQGFCPVQEVAAQFPQLCEAETQVFSQLLGVHVQRLSTMAGGAHVCTTHIPTQVTNPRNNQVEGSK